MTKMPPAKPLSTLEVRSGQGSGDLNLINEKDKSLLSSLLCGLPGRAVLVDVNGFLRFANQEFIDFVRRPREDVIGSHARDVLGNVVFDYYQPILPKLLAGEAFRWEGWTDYGTFGMHYVQEALTPYRPSGDAPVSGIIVVTRDLTDLKLREKELAVRIEELVAAEAYHAAFFRTALDGIVVIDDTGNTIDLNPAAETIFGYESSEALGRPIAELIVPPEYREAHAAGMRNYLETGASRILGKRLELSAIRKDGTRIPIELAITDVTRDGRRLFAAHVRDLSAAKKAEEEIRNQRNALHQKEKLAALGSLLAGVAHELNNPLSIVTGQTTMLRDQMLKDAHSLPAYERLLQRCDRIESAANRCARIVRSFLTMARQSETERNPADLVSIVREAVELLNYNMNASGVEIREEIAPDLPMLHLDANQIHQVLLNLLVNAQQSLEDKSGDRRITVSVALDQPASKVIAKVSDNGPGVPENLRSRIFEPFFTTKPQGVGTGVGLAVSRGLVEAHGGTLELDRTAAGAAFVITLPLEPAPSEVEPAGPVPPTPRNRTDKNRVLVVDDEPEIAALITEIVENLDYEPIVAHSGSEARLRVGENASGIAAILCDIRMPDGDGPGFYDWLLQNQPHLADHIGFVTGDTLGPSAGRFLARSGCPLIEKPFTPSDIEMFLADLTSNSTD